MLRVASRQPVAHHLDIDPLGIRCPLQEFGTRSVVFGGSGKSGARIQSWARNSEPPQMMIHLRQQRSAILYFEGSGHQKLGVVLD